MATYVNDLRLKEIATGDESGTWGTSTNTNLELIAEAFSFGTEGITTNADTHTTTIADGSTDPGRSIFLKYTGTLDSACTITIGPNTVSKLWFIENATSGSQNIVISQGSGASITIANGQTKAIYSDGAGSGAAMIDAFQDIAIPDLFIDDDLTFTSDSAVITFGVDGDTTLTHTDGSGLTLNSTNKIMFNDASQFIQGSSATVLSLGATDEIDLTATAIDVNGTMDVSGALTGTTATLTTADNLTQLQLVSTDTDANAGPVLDLFRSAGSSAADSDQTGSILFTGRNDAPETITYARINSFISDASDGTEDGLLHLKHIVAGSEVAALRLDSTEYVFNDSSLDVDFRVESDANTHALFVQASDGNVGIGTTPSTNLHVKNAADCTLLLQSGDSNTATILFGDASDTSRGKIKYLSSDEMVFEVNNLSEAMRIDSSSNVLIGTDNNSPVGNNVAGIGLFPSGAAQLSRDGGTPLLVNRKSSGGTSIDLRLDGSVKGTIGVESTGITVNDGSANLDFRVEGDSNANLLFVDAGNDRVMVGKSSTGLANQGVEFEDGQIKGTATGQTVAFLNRASDDGIILDIRKDNSTVGSIGSISSDLYIAESNVGLRFDGENNQILPASTTASTDGTCNLGASSARFNDLHLSNAANIGKEVSFTNSANSSGFDIGLVGGSSDATAFIFQRANDSLKFGTNNLERMVIDSSGNVGISATPSGEAAAAHVIRLGDQVCIAEYDDGSNPEQFNLFHNSDSSETYIEAGEASVIQQRAGVISFKTAASGSAGAAISFSERASVGQSEFVINEPSNDYDFRVESDGNANMLFVDAGNNRVGVGTNVPSYQFEVSNSSHANMRMLAGTNSSASIRLQNDVAHWDVNAQTNDNFAIYDQAAGRQPFTILTGSTSLVINEDSQDMDFRVESDAFTNMLTVNAGLNSVGIAHDGGTARLTCAQTSASNISGYFLNSASTIANSSASILYLQTTGDSAIQDGYKIVTFADSDTVIGTISSAASSTNVAYNTSSDERLKENIVDMESQLDKVLAAKPRQFNWKKNGVTSQGFIAQELQEVFPEAVTVGGEDPTESPWSVDYGRVTPFLMKAIQELSEQIKTLEAKVNALQGGE